MACVHVDVCWTNKNLNCTIDFVLIGIEVKDIPLACIHEASLNVFDLQLDFLVYKVPWMNYLIS